MNYKKEKFYSVNNIQNDMKKILTGLIDNFISGDFISVREFSRGIKNKGNLRACIENLNDKLPHYRTQKQKKKNDYSGLYLFATKNGTDFSYQYVGISQQVITRLKQHICVAAKGSATWAFLMAKVEHNQKNGLKIEEITANNFTNTSEANNAILKQQEKISKDYFVTYYPVDDNFLLHIVEPYVACELKCYWNSFETH